MLCWLHWLRCVLHGAMVVLCGGMELANCHPPATARAAAGPVTCRLSLRSALDSVS